MNASHDGNVINFRSRGVHFWMKIAMEYKLKGAATHAKFNI